MRYVYDKENMYEDWSVGMLCRKFDYSYTKDNWTYCNLPKDIEKDTGLKETVYDCMYRSDSGKCLCLEKMV